MASACSGPTGPADDLGNFDDTSTGGDGTTVGEDGAAMDESTGGGESSSDDGLGESGGGDDGAPAICGAGRVCVGAPPSGWSGPVAIDRSTAEQPTPSCQGEDYGEEAFRKHAGVDAPPFECGCECEPAPWTDCVGEVDIRLTPSSTGVFGGCGLTEDDTWFSGTLDDGIAQALSISIPDGSSGLFVDGYEANVAGSCIPEATQLEPWPTFADPVVACETQDVSEEGCGFGEQCVPSPGDAYDGGVCIWRDGDHECPTNLGYTQREVVFGAMNDSRSCSECSCGDVTGSCSDPRLTFEADCFVPFGCMDGVCECVNDQIVLVEDATFCEPLLESEFSGCSGSGCSVYAVEITDATYNAGEVEGAACPASGGQPMGTVEGADPVTICCAG